MILSLALCGLGVGLLAGIDGTLIHPHVTSPNPSTTLGTGPYFDYIVTVVLENQGINNTYGSRCSGNCTYITQLANSYGLAENYSAIGHPSLPNYLALTSGGNYDTPPFDRDCFPQSNGCFLSAPNIIDSIDGSSRT